MRRVIQTTLVFSTLFSPLWAQDGEDQEEDIQNEVILSTKPTTEWQNWAVAGGALVVAAIGALIVGLNTGSGSHFEN